jgi:hypothetical protein
LTFVPFSEANKIGDRFLQLLSDEGIKPPVYSGIEDELLSLTQLIEITKNPELVTGAKQSSILRTAAGIHDLAAKVLSVAPLAEFKNFVPHLRLIAEAKFPADNPKYPSPSMAQMQKGNWTNPLRGIGAPPAFRVLRSTLWLT